MSNRKRLPTSILSTQGEMEGMLEYFGLEQLAVESPKGLASQSSELVENESVEHTFREEVLRSVPEVRGLSRTDLGNAHLRERA